MKCKNCLYSIRYYNGKNQIIYYECIRFPPIVTHIKSDKSNAFYELETHFPRPNKNDYCFEFRHYKFIFRIFYLIKHLYNIIKL